MRDVVVEYGDRVRPAHWKGDEPHGTIWSLEGGEIAGRFRNSAFVVADVEVEHSSAGVAGEVLANLVGEWSDSC